MSDTYRYGIDLGTTNSVIARCGAAGNQLFTNPSDFGRQTLPSAVAWRKDRLLVGAKARELSTKPQGKGNSFAGFKRRMGSTESFQVQATGSTVTPIDLSAEVLKELRRFVPDDPNFTSAIVTIPASFDILQANATIAAAKQAGIKHVALLQEPIAASLAFANECSDGSIAGKWLVYDLGGGTFDVALVEAGQDQLRVIDHEGDNFLGGRDLDLMLLSEYIIPEIERKHVFAQQPLMESLVRASGRYNHVYEALLMVAESAKITLSARESVEVELDSISGFDDDAGEPVSIALTITRSDLEKIIRPVVDRSIAMVSALLTRNKLSGRDLTFVLLVGGSTYIPLIRKRLEETLEVRVRSDVDPTTVVAVGAAYYAGSKPIAKESDAAPPDRPQDAISLKAAYQRSSRDSEEYYAAKVDGWRNGLRYRITRRDGAFDTGWKELGKRITDDLPLKEGEYNFFDVAVTDASGRSIQVLDGEIAISHGKYSVTGQPLSEDVMLEKDIAGETRTECDVIFRKGTLLPAEGKPRKAPYTVGRTLIKGSDDALSIRVLYGMSDSRPDACLTIGTLEIRGRDLSADLFQGSSLDIQAFINENQQITIKAFLPDIDQAFEQVFYLRNRTVDRGSVGSHLDLIEDEASTALAAAESADDFQRAKQLRETVKKTQETRLRLQMMSPDDTTDTRYQVEDEKRRLAQDLARLTSDSHLKAAQSEYREAYERCRTLVLSDGNDADRQLFQPCEAAHPSIENGTNPARFKEAYGRLMHIYWSIKTRDLEFLAEWFEGLVAKAHTLNDQPTAHKLIAQGRAAIAASQADALRTICSALMSLLPNREQVGFKGMVGFH